MFSGYNTSGFVVLSEICLTNSSNCKVVQLYVVDQILSNNWFYGIQAGAGIVGIGPGSPFARQFIDINTNVQSYSIVVGR